MHADYIANPLYDNNPFIEALPPMLSGRDLIHALAVIPPYSDSDRDRSTGERLQLLSSLYEFYQPLSMTIDLYCEIYTAMQHCYGQYSIQSEAAAMQNGYSLMHGNALAASVGGGNSFSVIGVSGLGKSTALQRVLSLFPQVIEHTSYHGQNFYCHQIPYERDRKGSIQTTQEVEIYFNFVGRFVPPAFGEVELTPEELEEIRRREERKDRLHQNYLKRKANGKQKEYEERTKAKKKAEIEARKQAIRTEDIARGVFIPVSSLPQLGPRKGA